MVKIVVSFLFLFSSLVQESDQEIILEIRREFNRINSLGENLTIKRMNLEETSEHGELILYYEDSALVKVHVENYKVLGVEEIDFYLKDGRLFFSFSRVIHWDMSNASNPNYDPDEPKKVARTDENRYYFNKKESMIKWIDSQKRIIDKSRGDFREKELQVLDLLKYYRDK